MSKIGYFLALKPEQVDELVRDPSTVASFVAQAVDDQDELGADFLDIDKSWHAIHFLLTGVVEGGEAPWAWAVFAPTSIGEDEGRGPARVLMSDQVVELSKVLTPVTIDKLKRRCDWSVMNQREIFPGGWSAGDEHYVADNFSHLKKLYESAARRRMAVLQWISGA
ncbi:MAG: YfbM family protein [Povalibacter sp.]